MNKIEKMKIKIIIGKEDITKIKYEPWHWRFVGKENAKKMNKYDFCLEEYIERYEEVN